MNEHSRPPSQVLLSSKQTRRDTVEALRTVQRYAETLRDDAEDILTRCVQGDVDSRGLAEQLHAIDRSAASIRVMLGRLDGDSNR
jgi:hypothetical protein